MEIAPKRTPLYDIHVRLGAKMIEFGGWLMPVQYASIIEEHRAVRQAAGLFDLSHMGEIRISGPSALEFVQRITTNDASKLAIGQAHYSLLVNESGGVVDDFLVYRLPEEYLCVVNAANTQKDFEWMQRHRIPDVSIEDITYKTGMLGIQGPLSETLLQPLTNVDLKSLRYFHCEAGKVAGVEAIVSRTGYTGEDGFEVFCSWGHTEQVWSALESVANPPKPCGLGARDTLRLEAALCLYGHELDESINPFEARLGWVVKLDKPDFVGKEALQAIKSEGPKRLLVGFELENRGIARAGFPVLKDDQPVGRVTSGTFSPTLEKSIALGYVPAQMAQTGAEFRVDVRGRPLRARIVPIPFYKRSA